ncbi:MAG: Glycosyl transferase, group 1 [bacterium 42_11]|nr:MAG: Glycosyl transferase, group 1 [bacterium 42_11]
MRIAMIHWAFFPIIGGTETHLALLCPELVKLGHDVSLLTGAVDGTPEKEVWKGVTIKRTPLLNINSLINENIEEKYEEIRETFEEFLSDFQPDIVHAHNMHYFSYTHAKALQEICKSYNCPLILTAHNEWKDELWQKICTLSSNWNRIIAVSHYIRQELIVSGYPANRTHVVYHGIDLEMFHPPKLAEIYRILKDYPTLKNRRVIFHPARLRRGKGCDLSIRAMDILRREFPDAILVLAGNTKNIVDTEGKGDTERDYIYKLIEELELEEHVYISSFHWSEIPKIYMIADVCIYPSTSQEPFGLVLLESMATAKPIIVSRSGGMTEIVKPGFNGFVVDRGDYEGLARYISFLLKNPEIAEEIGLNGRQYVEENFTIEALIQNTLQVYESALKETISVA